MSIEHHWEGSLLIRDNIGLVQTKEILQSLITLGSDPRFDGMRYMLASWDKATNIQVGVEDIEKIRACIVAIERSNPNVRSVIYGLTGETNTALAYLYEALSIDSQWEVKVVDTEEEARAWLLEAANE